jgi:hypothetical protein
MQAKPLKKDDRQAYYTTLVRCDGKKCVGGIKELRLRKDIRWFIIRHVAGLFLQE